MLLSILRTITDFTVLVTRLTVEELTDEQRMTLIDQFIHIQGLGTVFDFDLHDLLMLLIMILIIVTVFMVFAICSYSSTRIIYLGRRAAAASKFTRVL